MIYLLNILIFYYSTGKQPTFHVIREVYDSSNAHERFEAELEKALEAKVDFIIIEPPRLGDETGKLKIDLPKTLSIYELFDILRSLDMGRQLPP